MEIGNKEWFQEEALNSCVRTGETTWDYSRSMLLWTPNTDKDYNVIQVSTAYSHSITTPEILFLKQFSREIMGSLRGDYIYIDLGPGIMYGKQHALMDQAQLLSKDLVKYVAVDINREMLELARGYLEDIHKIKTIICHDSFENLDKHQFLDYSINGKNTENFFYLGQTFMNFHFDDVCNIIDTCLEMSQYGCFYGNIVPREYVKDNLIEIYSIKENVNLLQRKMSLIGLERDDYSITITDDVYAVVEINDSHNCLIDGVEDGHSLLGMMSIRYEKKYIKEKLSKKYHCQYFDNGEFLGFLLRKK